MLLRICCVVLLLSASAIVSAEEVEGIPPAQPGEMCTPDAPGYTWKTVISAPWDIKRIVAVPVGVGNPEGWPQTPEFINALDQQRQAATGAEAFANSCVSIWGNFLEGDARVFILLGHSITERSRVLRCEDSSWTIQSDSTIEIPSESDWMSIDEQPWNIESSTGQQLGQKITGILDSINSQPSADTQPKNSYTSP